MTTTRGKTESARVGRVKATGSGEDDAADSQAGKTDWERMETVLNAMKGEICGKIDSMESDLREEICSVKQDIQKAVAPLQQRLDQQAETVRGLEQACTANGDQLTELTSTVNFLKTQVKLLSDKCEDLEGRGRLNNIRVIGVDEGLENARPTDFISRLLQEVLKLNEPPLLDRAHRLSRAKPKDGAPPRPFIIRVHYFHVRNEILRRAGDASQAAPLLYRGKRIFVFPDYTAAVSRKRAAFQPVKRLLHSCPGVKFGLLFPATLKITLPGGTSHSFEDSELAMDFVNTSIKKGVSPEAPF